MDITYIRMVHSFIVVAAVLAYASWRVMSWRDSITLDSAFCIAAVEQALARHGRSAILNTD